jgi:microcystin degradation protein MlrC
MRLFAAALALEANTFSPLPTSLAAFKEKLYYPPGTHPAQVLHQSNVFEVARRRAARDGYEFVGGSCFAAQPGGTVSKAAFEEMRDEILGQLRAALPVDGVVLALHGAMVAQGYDDCEGDMLARVRALVGPKTIIGVEYDPHCHATVARTRLSDIDVYYKEYPHIDFEARAEEVVTLVLATIRGDIRPVKSLFDCRLIASFPTTIEPMRSFVDKVSAMEGRDKVLSISIGHGFPYGDVPEMGARVLVITDGDKAHGDRLATELGHELITISAQASPAFLSPDAAIEAALGTPGSGPVVIADTTDNAGGGAPSDNTTFLHKLIARRIAGAAVAPIWDPMAVRVCFDAGAGARIPLRFGGKMAVTSGPPVDAVVDVLACVESGTQTFAGAPVPLGRVAAVRDVASGVAAILISVRAQAMGTDLFSGHGVDPKTAPLLVVKSNQHFHAAFAKIARGILYADGDGPQPRDYSLLPFARIARPILPLDATAAPKLLL